VVTRSDVLEKFFGRRVVSCLGWALLLFVALVISVLVYAYFKGQPPETPQSPSPRLPPPAGLVLKKSAVK
jgi:hypothetical protein